MRFSSALILYALPVTRAASKIHTFPLIPHSTIIEREDSHRGLLYRAERAASLYQGLGTHYVDLWIGSPEPQRQTVIVDTGSVHTAFPCEGCEKCGAANHTDSYFDFKKSTTFTKLGCEDCNIGQCEKDDKVQYCFMNTAYVEGSGWAAFEAQDRVYAGGKHDEPIEPSSESDPADSSLLAADLAFDMNFGCELKVSGAFSQQLSDGIMGMGNHKGALWRQMYAAEKIDKQMFSLCLLQAKDASKEGTEAGVMTMGGFDENLWNTPIAYAHNPASPSDTKYMTEIRAIYLSSGEGRKDFNFSVKDIFPDRQTITKIDTGDQVNFSGKAIVDSGTTSTYLNSAYKEPFLKAFKEASGVELSDKPFYMTDEQIKKLPNIVIQLHGADNDEDQQGKDPEQMPGLAGALDPENKHDVLVVMPPLHYLVYAGNDEFLFRVHFDQNFGLDHMLLGANFMRGHDVVFDVDNMKIGFAESNCDYGQFSGLKDEDKADV